MSSGTAPYPLKRKKEDPNFATQAQADQQRALCGATGDALAGGIDGSSIAAIAIDTTGSSVCHGQRAAQTGSTTTTCGAIIALGVKKPEITEAAHSYGLEGIDWCGGVYSSEWGFAKVLHWLRNNPDERSRFATALEHSLTWLCARIVRHQTPG